MTECPDCGKTIYGSRCKCGFRTTESRGKPHIHRDKVKDEADHLEGCRQWLLNNCVTTHGMSESERMKVMAAYRERIKREAVPDSLEWAKTILRRFEDGEHILPIQERMAKQALGI